MMKLDLTLSEFSHLAFKLEKLKCLVIGDLMLDKNLLGSTTRISPEAPVPLVKLESTMFALGGAANVANNLLNLINDEKVTFSHCVPTILTMLLASANKRKMKFKGLKMIIGGAALPQGLAKDALQKGINVFSAYGMSETCPFVSVAEVPQKINKKKFIKERCVTGKAAPLVELKVVDKNMHNLPKGSKFTGEVIIRSPWLTQGYVKDPVGSDQLWKDGYMHTGDVGYIDPNGSLIITDRFKDIIKSGGEWISSLELENLISKCKGVYENAIISIPDEKWGERPVSLVLADKETNSIVIEKSINKIFDQSISKGTLPKWAKPDKIIFVDYLDKTSVGKINKKFLRQKYK